VHKNVIGVQALICNLNLDGFDVRNVSVVGFVSAIAGDIQVIAGLGLTVKHALSGAF
jgi:hypothetical protein